MGNQKIDSAQVTELRNQAYSESAAGAVQDFDFVIGDATAEDLTSWDCDWYRWKGYYDRVDKIQSVIDTKALWAVGRGYKTDDKTRKLTESWKGSGHDTFTTLNMNIIRTYLIGGAFFGEKVYKDKFLQALREKEIANIKPLDPGTMRVVGDSKGIVTGFLQYSKDNKNIERAFKADDIFYIPWQRLADSLGGISTIQRNESNAMMSIESKEDLRVVFHRYVKPLLIFRVKTDDDGEISKFRVKVEQSQQLGENMILPDDVLANMEKVAIPQYSTLDPLPWIKNLDKSFILAENCPEVILGSSEGTEGNNKVLAFAWEQNYKFHQMYLKEQWKAQCRIDITFNMPPSIIEDLQKDEKKDSPINSNKTSELEQ